MKTKNNKNGAMSGSVCKQECFPKIFFISCVVIVKLVTVVSFQFIASPKLHKFFLSQISQKKGATIVKGNHGNPVN